MGAQVNIYASDGSVEVAIGGVELGQGINTKVAPHTRCACHIACHTSTGASQCLLLRGARIDPPSHRCHPQVAAAVAFTLGVPLESVIVGTTATNKTPNNTSTGGSGTSECSARAGDSPAVSTATVC